MELKNKVVIITGASSGIGLATAKLFFQKGARLALVSNEKEALENEAKKMAGALAIVADMANENEVKEMVRKVHKHFGAMDVLINNAGQGYQAPLEQVNMKTFHHIFNLNVAGPLVAMQEVIPLMRATGGGAIVNISSGTALGAFPGMSVYSSSKRALVGLSLTAREELKKDNIAVSVIYPYITDTNFMKNIIKEVSGNQQPVPNFPHPADSAEYIADKIFEAVETGAAEIFAHDWMNPKAN